jgi:predicted nucleic acid-binding protein
LSAFFQRVLIPPAVWAELLAFHSDLPDWLEAVTVTDSSRVLAFQKQVHPGEAEAIVLALEVKPDWLLIDDADGRKLTKSEGAPVVGLMGVLLMAKT